MAAAKRVENLYRRASTISDYLRSVARLTTRARNLHYSWQSTYNCKNDKSNEFGVNTSKQMSGVKGLKVDSLNLHLCEEEMMKYPIRRFTGNIHIVKDPAHERDMGILNVLNKLKQETVLGLDVEMTESSRRTGNHKRNKITRVVQIASETDAIVWQLNNFTSLPSSLVFFLKSDILKVGHAISDDVVLLKKEFNITSRRLFDTLPWAIQMDCKPLGLHALCAIFLGWRISKGLRTSDWSRDDLSQNQIHYACTDAWASLLVYREMKRVARENGRTAPLPIESVTDILDTRLESRRMRRSRFVQNHKARRNHAIMAETAEKIVE